MNLQDKTLTCRDCGQPFTFTIGEQEFHASRGFTNEPVRCPDCRAARRNERDSSGGGYGDRGYSRSERAPREMHAAVCAQCGKETQVPFRPTGERPVYCSDCFSSRREGSGGRSRSW